MSSESPAAFDAYAGSYEESLQRGVSLSGEDSSFFARGRVEWVGRRLRRLGVQAQRVLDFGCGTGSTAPVLLDRLGAGQVVGTDASRGLLDVARRDYASEHIRFVPLDEVRCGEADLVYCNGVFHHIAVGERGSAIRYIWGALRPAGLLAFWENNPWNPGTRIVMHRIPFDRDAEMLSAPEARTLVTRGGFETLSTDFLFVFPRVLSRLRRIEPAIARLPLGAQYLVLARKPGGR
jgi:SAM-dependent methyltransferase